MSEVELLKSYLEKEEHNKWCYSEDILGNVPKKNHEDDWDMTNKRIDILTNLIKRLEADRDE